METRLLAYFLKIAQTGTISQAARELHVTQPTLSRQLRALETELGTPLFVRAQHQMILTPAGSRYQVAARQILMLVDRAKQTAQATDQALSGTVAIGCTETNGAELVARAIRQFHHQYPAVTFSLSDLDATDIQERLDQGTLDLGVILRPSETLKYHRLSLQKADHWGVILPADHPLAQAAGVTTADLQRLPLLLTRNSLVQTEISDILGLDIQHLNVVGTQNLVTNSLYLAQQQVAFPLCAQGAFFPQTQGLVFVPLLGARPIDQQVIWSKQRELPTAATKFIRTLQTVDAS